MFPTLKHINKYFHISLLKKYNKVNHRRYQQFDQYIKKQNYTNINNYQQFCVDGTVKKNIQLNLTQKQENHVHSMFGRQRKGLAWTKKSFYPIHRTDDHELDQLEGRQIQNKTLLSFTKQAIKERKDHHQLYFLIIISIILNPLLYFCFWFGDEREYYEAIYAVNPEQEEKYRLEACGVTVKGYQNRIKMYAREILNKQTLNAGQKITK